MILGRSRHIFLALSHCTFLFLSVETMRCDLVFSWSSCSKNNQQLTKLHTFHNDSFQQQNYWKIGSKFITFPLKFSIFYAFFHKKNFFSIHPRYVSTRRQLVFFWKKVHFPLGFLLEVGFSNIHQRVGIRRFSAN